MDKNTLMSLAGALVLIIVLVVAADAMLGGLPAACGELFAVEESETGKAAKRIDTIKTTVSDIVAKEKAFLEPKSSEEKWQADLDDAGKEIDAALASLEKEGKAILENDDSGDEGKLKSLLQAARTRRMQALGLADSVLKRAETLLYYKANRAKVVKKANQDFDSIESPALAQLEIKAEKAKADWPEKMADIEQKMSLFDSMKQKASESHAFIAAENVKPESEVDFEALGMHGAAIADARETYLHSVGHIAALLGQLYVSWDRILDDMEIREGEEVRFYHHYKTIKVFREGDSNRQETSTKIVQVSKTVYQSHEKNLGMTLASKPQGKYDSEADTKTSPPGYNYVGNPHYGKWERHSSGSSFWVFYGQYALMRDLFWGRSYYQPIYRSDWNSYQHSRNAGRTYYGRSSTGGQKYGSKGEVARTKYKGSRYTSSRGFSGTQFKKSGGTYRGSKYAAKSRSSYSSSRSRSSSMFRSGSRGGGGK